MSVVNCFNVTQYTVGGYVTRYRPVTQCSRVTTVTHHTDAILTATKPTKKYDDGKLLYFPLDSSWTLADTLDFTHYIHCQHLLNVIDHLQPGHAIPLWW